MKQTFVLNGNNYVQEEAKYDNLSMSFLYFFFKKVFSLSLSELDILSWSELFAIAKNKVTARHWS